MNKLENKNLQNRVSLSPQIFSKLRNFIVFSARPLVFSKIMRTFAIHFTEKMKRAK